MGIVAFILGMLLTLIGSGEATMDVTVIPPMPAHPPVEILYGDAFHYDDCLCDDCCHDEVYFESWEEFTALFNSYEYKVSKNGRGMIRRPEDKTFTFVSKG